MAKKIGVVLDPRVSPILFECDAVTTTTDRNGKDFLSLESEGEPIAEFAKETVYGWFETAKAQVLWPVDCVDHSARAQIDLLKAEIQARTLSPTPYQGGGLAEVREALAVESQSRR